MVSIEQGENDRAVTAMNSGWESCAGGVGFANTRDANEPKPKHAELLVAKGIADLRQLMVNVS